METQSKVVASIQARLSCQSECCVKGARKTKAPVLHTAVLSSFL